ncbi:MAG TPA: FAD/NAD(P)-binding protein, partial [Planctomycetaceae bacterium]
MTATSFPTVAQSDANPWLAHSVVIASITSEIEGVATFHLRFSDPHLAATYRFRPGQFNMLYLPGVGESAISLSADPASRDTWAHTVRVAGNVTGTLFGLGAGGSLGLRGPFGSSWPLELAENKSVILVAGGIGLPPLRPVIYEILSRRDQFQDVTLLYGARTPETLMYPHEYDAWSRQGIAIHTTVDRSAPGWRGHVGVVPLLLDRLKLRDAGQTQVFMCGPEVMMRFAVKSALHQGIPQENLWLSMERNMQCAIGLCGHCQFGPT